MSDPFDTAAAFIWGPDRDGSEDDSAPEGKRLTYGGLTRPKTPKQLALAFTRWRAVHRISLGF